VQELHAALAHPGEDAAGSGLPLRLWKLPRDSVKSIIMTR
jgi:hypothetical protein